MDALAAATDEELTAVPSIGPKIAASVVAYMGNLSNLAVIEKLRRADVRLEDESRETPASQALAGSRFVVTGRLQGLSRSEIESRIKELGGTVSSSVSRNTDYLIAGEEAGSKLANAEALEIPVITEEEFLALAEGE